MLSSAVLCCAVHNSHISMALHGFEVHALCRDDANSTCCAVCCQDYEAETREQLRQPANVVEAQIAATPADWQFAQTEGVYDHKLVII